jgi:hypothetical protein
VPGLQSSFISLFGAAFPLAALLALIANMLELRIGGMKLVRVREALLACAESFGLGG